MAEPEVARSTMFAVFFDVDRAELGTTALHTLHDIADIVRQGHVARITLSVHSAAAGWDEHSQELSERRAAAIRAVLVKDGVADAKITTVTVARDQLVPAMDGLRSPENRRTDIILY